MLVNERNRRILIVDDNESIHGDYRKILCREVGNRELDDLSAEIFGEPSDSSTTECVSYELESAYQGQEAFQILTQAVKAGRPFALAFVDMRMPPGWDGLETIQNLWKVDPNLNVVICTAFSDHSWEDMTRQLGSNDRWLLLRKPFDSSEVAQLAASLVEKHHLFREITNRMELSEDKLRVLLNTAPDGILACDSHGKIVSINQAAERLLLVTAKETLGRNIADFLASEDAISLFNEYITSKDTEEVLSIDCRSPRTGSDTFAAHWTIGKLVHQGNIGFTAILRDETERERLRCELTQAHKLEAVGQLAAGIAHEINTPTQYVAGNMEFLRDTFAEIDEVQSELVDFVESCARAAGMEDTVAPLLKRIEDADLDYLSTEIPKTLEQTCTGVARIAKIVQAMKDFSHPGSTEKSLADIHSAIRSTMTVSQNEWKYCADIETTFDPTLTAVPCLIAELNHVFINLIVNAAHAIAEKAKSHPSERGKICITTKRDGAFAVIEIADTGNGIPDSIKNRVFDPFFTTKGVGKGTGQGLAIARSVVVDKHRGTLEFTSQPGVGTTFIVRLPMEDTKRSSSTPRTSEIAHS